MLLQDLKNKLQVITGTSIGQVYFDWKIYSDISQSRIFPVVVWNLDGATFVEDYRTLTINKFKLFTLTAFAINVFPIDSDKITVWDTLEGYFKAYLNAMNITDAIQIFNIDKIKGQYLGQDVDKGEIVIGISYKDIQIKMFCG